MRPVDQTVLRVAVLVRRRTSRRSSVVAIQEFVQFLAIVISPGLVFFAKRQGKVVSLPLLFAT